MGIKYSYLCNINKHNIDNQCISHIDSMDLSTYKKNEVSDMDISIHTISNNSSLNILTEKNAPTTSLESIDEITTTTSISSIDDMEATKPISSIDDMEATKHNGLSKSERYNICKSDSIGLDIGKIGS